MINIVKKKINMSDELKTKINWSCRFNKKSYQIIEDYLRIVEHTNLAYVEPHKELHSKFEFRTDFEITSLKEMKKVLKNLKI